MDTRTMLQLCKAAAEHHVGLGCCTAPTAGVGTMSALNAQEPIQWVMHPVTDYGKMDVNRYTCLIA